jgi:hypothetical protein
MTTQQKRLLEAKISIALLTELGRQPTREEVKRYSLAARVLYKVILGLHYARKVQQETGQLALF